MRYVLIEPLECRQLLSGIALAPSLDPRWQQADVGTVGVAGEGSSSKSAGSLAFTLTGSGTGAVASADSFHFVYQPIGGNGRIIARIASESATTNPLAAAGVVLRESLVPGARMVGISITSGGATFSDRPLTDDPIALTVAQPVAFPQWVKLVRAGNTFTGYVSPNRNKWSLIGSVQIPMTVNLEAGLTVSAGDTTELATATIDHVQANFQKTAAAAAGWQTLADAPIPLYESSSASVNGKLYVFGGFYNEQTQSTPQSDVYDPATNAWTRLADMPFVVTHSGVAVVGTDIYFAGGFLGDWLGPNKTDQTDLVFKYDTLSNSWSGITPLPASRAAGGLVAIGQQLHFFCGTDEFVQNDMADHWMLDLSNPAAGWVTETPMPNPRDHFGYTVLNGLIYAIGGEHLVDEIHGADAEVDRYDPASNTWTVLAPLPLALSHIHTNTVLINNRIVIFGGSADGDVAATIVPTVSAYNPLKNTWVNFQTLPEPRSATVARVVGNEIIVTGGENEFMPRTSTWGISELFLQRQLRMARG